MALTGRTVELMLHAAMGHPMSTAMYEGFCAGNSQTQVRGAVVCYAPTLDMLRRAAAEQKNLIISREHPFFLHGGLHYGYATGGLEAALKDDPVVQAKRETITKNQLMVYRLSTAWDQFRPKAQSESLAKALGLNPPVALPADRSRAVVCNVQPTSLQALAQIAADRLKVRSPRTIGDAGARVTRVAVLAGETDPPAFLAELLRDTKIDAVIAGAGGVVDEVDGAIGYFQDVIASGRRIAMLAIGYGPSQDPGGEELARWLKPVLSGVSVDWWPTADPSWIPKR